MAFSTVRLISFLENLEYLEVHWRINGVRFSHTQNFSAWLCSSAVHQSLLILLTPSPLFCPSCSPPLKVSKIVTEAVILLVSYEGC